MSCSSTHNLRSFLNTFRTVWTTDIQIKTLFAQEVFCKKLTNHNQVFPSETLTRTNKPKASNTKPPSTRQFPSQSRETQCCEGRVCTFTLHGHYTSAFSLLSSPRHPNLIYGSMDLMSTHKVLQQGKRIYWSDSGEGVKIPLQSPVLQGALLVGV